MSSGAGTATVWSMAWGLYRVPGVGWDRAAQGQPGIRDQKSAAGHGARWADVRDVCDDGMMGGNDGMMAGDGQWRWLQVMASGWRQVPGLA